jgi:hypothetical protein
MTLVAVDEDRLKRLEEVVSHISETITIKPTPFDDLIEASLLKEKLGNPHPSTWWRWEKKGLLGKPITIGTKKMYRLSEIDSTAK